MHAPLKKTRNFARTPVIALVTARAARGLDEDIPPLIAACSAASVKAEIVDWDDGGIDWARFDLALLLFGELDEALDEVKACWAFVGAHQHLAVVILAVLAGLFQERFHFFDGHRYISKRCLRGLYESGGRGQSFIWLNAARIGWV